VAGAEAGADALGFIFAASPRQIEVDKAAEIIARLPENVEKVGVFVNESCEQIADTVNQAGLTAVQLHGDESLDFARAVKDKTGVKMVRAVSSDFFQQAAERAAGFGLLRRTTEVYQALLIDSAPRVAADPARPPGGTGLPFPWDENSDTFTLLNTQIRVILAGGLRPDNVVDAMDKLHPWGVDVVTGVETSPGRKDHAKLREFVRAVRQLDRL